MKVEVSAGGQDMQPLLKVENLVKRYATRSLAGAREELLALNGVSFTIFPGTTLAVVGESGSGKSTLASCLACLESPTTGNIWFEGEDIVKLPKRARRQVRPKIQLMFQDPASSLRSEEHTSELQSQSNLVCRLLLEQKNTQTSTTA